MVLAEVPPLYGWGLPDWASTASPQRGHFVAAGSFSRKPQCGQNMLGRTLLSFRRPLLCELPAKG